MSIYNYLALAIPAIGIFAVLVVLHYIAPVGARDRGRPQPGE